MARPAVRNRRWLVAGAGGLVLAGVISYGAAAGPAAAAGHRAARRPAGVPAPPAVVRVSPADGAVMVAPDAAVRVTAAGGTLSRVMVASGGSAVAGWFGPGGASWSTRWGLRPGAAYTVTAVARNGAGAATTAVTHFRTRAAARVLQISGMTPGPGETVGVGMPIIVDFNAEVTGGVHLTMGSYDAVWMTSPNISPGQPGYYHELVYDDVQISGSGEYMHQSPGSVWCLGHQNCSHGCVRMTADGAAWWRHTAYRGDPVTITGTPRVLAWDNGWGYWQQPWPAWLQGSAAGPVTTTALRADHTHGPGPPPPPNPPNPPPPPPPPHPPNPRPGRGSTPPSQRPEDRRTQGFGFRPPTSTIVPRR